VVDGMSVPLFKLPLDPLWSSTVGFVAVFCLVVFAIGLASKNLAVGATGAYVMFVHFGVLVEDTMIQQTMYVSLVMVALGLAFKLWNTEMDGGGA
jgi:TctA family transporter